MTDLEIVLGVAFGVMVYLWNRQTQRAQYYRAVIIAVGLGHARVEIDDDNKAIRVTDVKNGA